MSQLENLDSAWNVSEVQECAKRSILSRAKEAMCVLQQEVYCNLSGLLFKSATAALRLHPK